MAFSMVLLRAKQGAQQLPLVSFVAASNSIHSLSLISSQNAVLRVLKRSVSSSQCGAAKHQRAGILGQQPQPGVSPMLRNPSKTGGGSSGSHHNRSHHNYSYWGKGMVGRTMPGLFALVAAAATATTRPSTLSQPQEEQEKQERRADNHPDDFTRTRQAEKHVTKEVGGLVTGHNPVHPLLEQSSRRRREGGGVLALAASPPPAPSSSSSSSSNSNKPNNTNSKAGNSADGAYTQSLTAMFEQFRVQAQQFLDSAEGKELGVDLGVGTIAGFTSGYAVKKMSKVLGFLVGVGFIVLQVMRHHGYLEVDWSKVEDSIVKALDADGDGKLTEKDAKIHFDKGMGMLGHSVPSASAFATAFILGLRYG